MIKKLFEKAHLIGQLKSNKFKVEDMQNVVNCVTPRSVTPQPTHTHSTGVKVIRLENVEVEMKKLPRKFVT